MALRRVRITAFRCFAEADLSLSPQRNFVYGPNGAGKTSLLEAIHLLGRGRSFRTRHIRRLVRHGSSGLAVFAEVAAVLGLRRIGIAFENGRLQRGVDGQSGANGVELAALLPVHVIEPGSHELIQGGPSERRRFLDWGAFHVEHSYLDAWRRYRRVLGQRNAALKSAVGTQEVAAWTAALLDAGLAVHEGRQRYVEELGSCFTDYGGLLLGGGLSLGYEPGWSADLSFEQALRASEARDRSIGNTEVGPHRADLAIRLDGRRAQNVASRGQQKLVAAALILAQARVLEARQSRRGVLLIDDPAAELDASSLERFMRAAASIQAQTIFTAITPEALPFPVDSAVFHVERGVLRAL